jgi:16S rRNA (adenine(1408)-N(1))-methyltransferase
MAREHPTWFCLAIDASADAMRRISLRAGRKPSRGGAPNVRFVRAAVEALPRALDGIADEVTVYYPWGSLRRALIEPHPESLRRITRLGRSGASFRARVNDLDCAAGLAQRLRDEYADAGITLISCAPVSEQTRTSWGRRLGSGRPIAVVAIEGILSGVLPPADVVEIVAVDVIHDDDGEVFDDEPVDGLRTQIRKGDHLGR